MSNDPSNNSDSAPPAAAPSASTQNAQEPVQLQAAELIGAGLDRNCYLHPQDSSRCIKVTVSGDATQAACEFNYLRRLIRRGISWRRLARLEGVVATDLGEGLVFQLIRDFDGSISRTLAHYLADEARTEKLPWLRRELDELKKYLLEQRIITRDLKSQNIVVQWNTPGQATLVIIDGVGNNEFIPISDWFAPLGRRKILRKWAAFEQTLKRKFPENKGLEKLLLHR